MTERYCREIFEKQGINAKTVQLVSSNGSLSEEFMREFADKLNWSIIAMHQKLSESFLREMRDKIDWRYYCRSNFISEKMMEEMKEKLSWSLISEYQKLSENFINKHDDKIKVCYLTHLNNHISDEFIKKHFKEFNYMLKNKYARKFEKLGLK